ncbi:Rieske (2Fe-2S) protein [Actinoplanes sp. NPDC048791]|uniref:Rieske (2Fe-2S) protein n=1 Tax=Actinoplanes sp. NPDC048791 TaxID=3154623 RepID=UPI0033DFBA1C
MRILGPVTDIPLGEGRTYEVDGEMVAVFRLRDGSVRALSAVCPHRGGPLADGQIDKKVLVCPLHLMAFDLTTGCSLSGISDLTVYPVTVDADGHLVISSLTASEVPS